MADDDLNRRFDRTQFQHPAIVVGTAGEHIVCADLILSGYRAFLTSAGLPYDVIAEVGGRLLRFAVRATLTARAIWPHTD